MILKKLAEMRTFTFPEKVRLAAAIAEILGQIHASGYIHRDIKPTNITYNPATDQLQIIDFGSAKNIAPGVVESEVSRKLGQTDAFDFIQMFRQVVANLAGNWGDPLTLDGPYWNEEETLARETKADNRGRDFSLYTNKLFLNLLFGNYTAALGDARQVWTYTEGFPPVMPLWAQFVFGETLIHLSLIEKADPEERKGHEEKIGECLAQLNAWQRQAPMNIAHKLLLVKAEMARIENHPSLAAELYDEAILAAKENGYLQEEALYNELAARFYLNRKKSTIGRSYLLDAC